MAPLALPAADAGLAARAAFRSAPVRRVAAAARPARVARCAATAACSTKRSEEVRCVSRVAGAAVATGGRQPTRLLLLLAATRIAAPQARCAGAAGAGAVPRVTSTH